MRSLFAILSTLLLLAACDNAAERKAKEEAAINAGTSSTTQAADPDSPAARAAAAEAAELATNSPLLTPPAPPVDTTSQARSEIEGIVDGIACRPDISAQDCAQAKASLAGDMHELLNDRVEACTTTLARIEAAQQQLVAQSSDLEADLGALSRDISDASEWYQANCTG